jgi:hypothetical protein
MTYLALAKVWIHLQPRLDTSNIIREILGQYALSVAGKQSEIVRALSFRFVVWMKVIFDMQRTYSQSAGPSTASIPYLVHPRLLFAAIYKIVDIRSQVYGDVSEVDSVYLEHRCFVAQVLLSGLRALLLRKGEFSATEILGIRQEVSNWVSHSSLEETVLKRCLDAITYIPSSPGASGRSNIHKPACDILERELLEKSRISVRPHISCKSHAV